MAKTSSQVKRRYNDKTYKAVRAELKKELVEAWEAKLISEGISKAEFLRNALEDYLKSPGN